MSKPSYGGRSGVVVTSLGIRYVPPLATLLLHIAVCLLLNATTGVIAHAQETTTNLDLGAFLSQIDPNSVTILDENGQRLTQDNQQFNQVLRNLARPGALGRSKDTEDKKSIFENMSKITLSPSMIVVDHTSRTVTLQLVNLGYDSVPLDFVVRAHPQQFSSLFSAMRGRSRTTGVAESLAGWVQDVPQRVILAPGESRTVTMHIAVPPDAAPGTYAADVVVYYKPTIKIDESTDLSNDVVPKFFADTTANGFPSGIYVLTQVVYTVPKGNQRKSSVGTH